MCSSELNGCAPWMSGGRKTERERGRTRKKKSEKDIKRVMKRDSERESERQYVCVYLWGVHEVHLQQASLQGPLGGPVVLQGVQQEGGALLDQVVLHEHVHDLDRETRVSHGVWSFKSVLLITGSLNALEENRNINF